MQNIAVRSVRTLTITEIKAKPITSQKRSMISFGIIEWCCALFIKFVKKKDTSILIN